MRPFSLLVKPSSADCNLECTYCFYLPRKDLYPESHRHQMGSAVLEQMISSYMATSQPTYTFGWQGGEPTLMGRRFFERVTELQEKYGRRGSVVANGLQTNGTLLSDDLARHLARTSFLVGISIDGPAEIHDTYRLRVGQHRGSHADVLRGLETLKRHGVEYNVLTLVSAANVHEPRKVYRYLRDELGLRYHQYIPCVEFQEDGSPAPYSISAEDWGSFMNGVFDEWISGDTRTVSVRHFDNVISSLLGQAPGSCVLGTDCRQYFVVEHNGDVYPCDFFVDRDKLLGNIMNDRWENLWHSSAYRQFGRMKRQWNSECASCPFLKVCAGDCTKLRTTGKPETPGSDELPVSALCGGWRAFYGHTLDRFGEIAREVQRDQTRAYLKLDNPTVHRGL